MKTICAVLLLTWCAVPPAQAAVSTAEAKRLNEAAEVLHSLRSTPDKDIPKELWGRADCVVVIPSMKKAAFVFGGEYGKGVMTCKRGPEQTGTSSTATNRTETGTTAAPAAAAGIEPSWSAPAFMQLAKGSWGLQIGAAQIDLVLLVMNRTGARKLLESKVNLGAGASVAAGPVGRTAAASTDAQLSAEILTYSHTSGVFAGIDLSGGVLGPDNDANQDAYGPGITAQQIVLENRVTAPVEAQPLMAALRTQFEPTATTGVKP